MLVRREAYSDPDWIFEIKYNGFRSLAPACRWAYPTDLGTARLSSAGELQFALETAGAGSGRELAWRRTSMGQLHSIPSVTRVLFPQL